MKNVKNKVFLAALLMLSVGYSACTTASKVANGVTNFLMPNISEDVKMGQQTDAEIKSKPKEYPLLPESGALKKSFFVAATLPPTILWRG